MEHLSVPAGLYLDQYTNQKKNIQLYNHEMLNDNAYNKLLQIFSPTTNRKTRKRKQKEGKTSRKKPTYM